MKDVDYASGKAPPDYRCGSCGAHGVKLWRLAYAQELFCAACSASRAGESGFFVPAVPKEDGSGVHDLGLVPPVGLAWWKALPMAQPQPAASFSPVLRAEDLRRMAGRARALASSLAPIRSLREERRVWDAMADDIDAAAEREPQTEQSRAQPATDADIAREFFRRFVPVKLLLRMWEGSFVEGDDERWLSGTLADSAMTEEHAAGEDGFVAALERALELVRKVGG